MKFICGPMATISHPAFRILIEKFGGCDEYFTEMINAGSLLNDGPFEKYYVNPAPVPGKVVWQLTGTDRARMAEAAKRLVELPGIGLDVNMGCSAPDIYKTGAGIGWMLRPLEETREMVRSVGEVISSYNKSHPELKESGMERRFSVKLRLGDEDFTEEGLFAFCDMLVENGVKLLTLHPRTKKEKLARPARYFYCQNLAERYKKEGVSLYLNGNIKDSASASYAAGLCPDCSGIMISRAAVQKPWIFRELKKSFGGEGEYESGCESELTVDMKQLCLDYIKDVEVYQPPEFWKTRLQRFFTYFAMNFTFGHYAQTQFINASDNQDLIERIEDFFAKCPEERFKKL